MDFDKHSIALTNEAYPSKLAAKNFLEGENVKTTSERLTSDVRTPCVTLDSSGDQHGFEPTWIRPDEGWLSGLSVSEIWKYRDLLAILVWRDITVWYKQTLLGVAWAVLQPLAAMVVFAVVFGMLAKMPSNGAPYPVFAYAGLVLWSFFAQAVTQAANSLVENEKLVTRVYFPRLLVPVAAVGSCLLHMLISGLLLFVLLPWYGLTPSTNVWILPVAVGLAVLSATGVGLWLAAFNVRYRDVRYVIPFLIQVWMYASPVVYPASLIPVTWRPLVGLNPMAGAIETFRWGLLGTNDAPWQIVAVSLCSMVFLLTTGLVYFQRVEKYFADVI